MPVLSETLQAWTFVAIDSAQMMNFYALFQKVWNVLEQFKTQYQIHYANDADELERYGFFKKSKARVTKHGDQSKEHHHEGANLDQSCRSERFIVEKCPMRYEPIGSREFDEHSESGLLVTAIEALRKNLALKCNAKRSGGLSLLCWTFGHVPDDWLSLCW